MVTPSERACLYYRHVESRVFLRTYPCSASPNHNENVAQTIRPAKGEINELVDRSIDMISSTTIESLDSRTNLGAVHGSYPLVANETQHVFA